MICTSIVNKSVDEVFSIMDDPFVEMGEIRLDLCDYSVQDLQELIEYCEKPLLVSCHVDPALKGEEKNRAWERASGLYAAAIDSGVSFIDLDINAPVHISQSIQKSCKNGGIRLIRSFHDYEKTPEQTLLKQTILRCFRYGADIAKIACKANTQEDVTRLQGFYDTLLEDNHSIKAENLILISMGGLGEQARVDCLGKGAPLSFAYYDAPSAEGQLSFEQMHEKVYGQWRGVHKKDFHAPCSKSYAQRSIIAAALSEGTSTLRGFTPCDDSLSAIEVVRKLGATVKRHADTIKIEGIGPVRAESMEIDSLNVGESGLLARLCIPLSAVLSQKETLIEGCKTLLDRPLKGASDIMAGFGILLENKAKHPDNKNYIPLCVKGKFYPGTAELPGEAGSQLISGLLMALPLCQSDSQMFISDPKSIPYMFMTQDILKQFGIKTACELEGNAKMLEQQDWSYCNGIHFKVRGGQQYKAAEIDLEADWSAAAAFLTYGALFGEAEVDGLNTESIQADITILDILSDAGACISYDQDVVSVKRSVLQAFEYDLNNAPDLIPLAALLAAFCPGQSTIAGVQRLRSKESDRAEAILTTLSQMGVEARINGDELRVKGMSLTQRFLSGHLLKGGKYTSFHDHRMVMLLSLAQMGADSPIEIDDTECVSKSFPRFFEEMTL